MVIATDPYGHILGFVGTSSVVLTRRGPFPDPLFLRKSGSAGNYPEPLDLYPRTLTTRPQRRCALAKNEIIVPSGNPVLVVGLYPLFNNCRNPLKKRPL
jgi:hypothetical protein